MENSETPISEGTTIYVVADPDGIGATVDRALAGGRATSVIVCGPSMGRHTARWSSATGAWFHVDQPYFGATSYRARLARDGVTVRVTRAETWFGDASPAAVRDATRYVRHTVGLAGAQMVGTPGRTGLAMLDAIWRKAGRSYEPCPADVQELIRSTSGQGRFEVFPAGAAGGRNLVAVDARFQYAALAGLELPVGLPDHVTGTEPEPYAPSWCEVEWTCNADTAPVGLLPVPVELRGKSWAWPAAGTHRGWCSGAEVHLARQHGYRVRTLQAFVWPGKARPLASWSALLIRERDRVETLPLGADVQRAVRAALRGVAIQTIGTLHGRPTRSQRIVCDSSEVPGDALSIRRLPDGRWQYETNGAARSLEHSHPEWSSAIWALARVRLARHLLRQPADRLVACALDAYYTEGAPVADDDDGRAGAWRHAGEFGAWEPVATMADVYRLTKGR